MTGTERKTFQKYYPPDFDPRKIPAAKKDQFAWVQRVMTPFNMTCNTCGEYIYKGKKFNMRREMVSGKDYLGLRLWRFYFRCPNCIAEIVFRTDLESCDYVEEHGCTRLFEAHKFLIDEQKKADAVEEEERTNPMKMLEKRTKMSRKELEQLSILEEIREQNKTRGSTKLQEQVLADYAQAMADDIHRQEMEDELEIRRLFGKKEVDETEGGSGSSGLVIKRIKDESGSDSAEDNDPVRLAARAAALKSDFASTSTPIKQEEDHKPTTSQLSQYAPSETGASVGTAPKVEPTTALKIAMKRRPPEEKGEKGLDQRNLLRGAVLVKKKKSDTALSSLMGAYGSGSDSSEAETDAAHREQS